MRYRLAWMGSLALLIVVPLFVSAASVPATSGRPGGAWSQARPMLGAEFIVLGLVLAADWNRRRLLARCVRRIDQDACARERTLRVPGRLAPVTRRDSAVSPTGWPL